MAACWEPGTSYGIGSVVEYQGAHYKIIQAHTSQSDWTPPATPALWGKTQGHDHGNQHQGQQQQHYQQNQQQQQQQQQPPATYQPAPQHYPSPPSDQKVDIHPEETNKNWYDLTDDRKEQLKIGGGLLAGAALLGGGFAAYKQHENNEEDRNAQAWALQNWSRDAQARRNEYNQNGLRAPAMWVYNEGKSIPQGSITTGREKDWDLYIARVPMHGGIQIGKASDVFKKGAVVGYGNDEIHLSQYEILVGDMRGLRWVPASGKLRVETLGARPVEGGREGSGAPLYVGKAPHKGAVHPGKCGPELDGCRIPFDGKEKVIDSYEVLCYA